MTNADTGKDVEMLESSIKAIDKLLNLLEGEINRASFAQRKKITAVMAELSFRRQISADLAAQLKSSNVEVAPASEDSYKKLDEAMKELQEAQQDTNSVEKVLQVAGAISSAINATQENVKSRIA